MNKTYKIVAAVVLLIIGLFIGLAIKGSNGSQSVGSIVENFPSQYTNGIVIGATGVNGTLVKGLMTGTVNCSNASTTVGTVAALATTTLDCKVTGARSTDIVFGDMPIATVPNLRPISFYASTTNDYIEVGLYNIATSSTASLVGATSSVEYLILKK